MKDIGHLIVKVMKAQGLHSADLGGKSDPFAVVEIVNDRLQTQTEYKTLAPVWQKVFTLYVELILFDKLSNHIDFFSDIRDIHDIVEITVYDEDKDHKYEFLGRVQIPLLRVKNGERRWLKLKDKTLRKKAKGEEAEILVELNLFWNP